MFPRHLGRNPLTCDCKLKWLNDYFRSKPVERSGLQCTMPKRLAKKSIGSIPNSKFKCNATTLSDYYLEEFCITMSACPNECACQGTVVDCRGQGLTEIPANIPHYVTEL
jgi:slit protein 2